MYHGNIIFRCILAVLAKILGAVTSEDQLTVTQKKKQEKGGMAQVLFGLHSRDVRRRQMRCNNKQPRHSGGI